MLSESQLKSMRETTARVLGLPRLRNWAHNVARIDKCAPISVLEGAYEGKACFVVGAGPSLAESLPRLRELQKLAVIIAVDSAVPCLLAAGITPHVVATVDPQHLTERKLVHVSDEETADSLLVAHPCAVPSILRRPWAARFLWTGPPSGATFDVYTDWVRTACCGGNAVPYSWEITAAVHLALNSAILMGCRTVFFAGVDLCYTPGCATHVEHTVLREMHSCKPPGSAEVVVAGHSYLTRPAFVRQAQIIERTLHFSDHPSRPLHERFRAFQTALGTFPLRGAHDLPTLGGDHFWSLVPRAGKPRYNSQLAQRGRKASFPAPSIAQRVAARNLLRYLASVRHAGFSLPGLLARLPGKSVANIRKEVRCVVALGGFDNLR